MDYQHDHFSKVEKADRLVDKHPKAAKRLIADKCHHNDVAHALSEVAIRDDDAGHEYLDRQHTRKSPSYERPRKPSVSSGRRPTHSSTSSQASISAKSKGSSEINRSAYVETIDHGGMTMLLRMYEQSSTPSLIKETKAQRLRNSIVELEVNNPIRCLGRTHFAVGKVSLTFAHPQRRDTEDVDAIVVRGLEEDFIFGDMDINEFLCVAGPVDDSLHLGQRGVDSHNAATVWSQETVKKQCRESNLPRYPASRDDHDVASVTHSSQATRSSGYRSTGSRIAASTVNTSQSSLERMEILLLWGDNECNSWMDFTVSPEQFYERLHFCAMKADKYGVLDRDESCVRITIDSPSSKPSKCLDLTTVALARDWPRTITWLRDKSEQHDTYNIIVSIESAHG